MCSCAANLGGQQLAVVLHQFPLEVRHIEVEDLRSRAAVLELDHRPAVGQLADVVVLVLHQAHLVIFLLAAAIPS